MYTRVAGSVIAILAVGVVCGATSADVDFKVLPAETEIVAVPGELTTVELDVAITTRVGSLFSDGLQGWQLSLVVENNDLEELYIENAIEHPDLTAFGLGIPPFFPGLPNRVQFHSINYFLEGDLANWVERASAPDPFTGMPPEHDVLDGVPGVWAALIEGVTLDLTTITTLPASEDFGVLALTVKVGGTGSGRLVLPSEGISDPVIDPVAVFFGMSITPGVLAPATITAIPPFIRGDFDASGDVDLADAIQGLQYVVFGHGSAPTCLDAADANDDGQITLADPIYTLAALFIPEIVIPDPWPDCGEDPSEDELGCESFAPCE